MSAGVKAADEWLAVGLAFVGGFGDAAGFVLAKAFTGHITGNLVLAAISAAAMDWPTAVTRLSAVVSFLGGVLLSVLLMWSLSSRQPSIPFVSSAIAVEALLILGAYWAFVHHPFGGAEVFIVLLSLALGVQNGAVRRAGALSVHTTYLTGMITGLMVAEAERIHPRTSSQATATSDPRMRVVGAMWALFFVGAAVGAALVDHFNAAGILWVLPVLLLLGITNAQATHHLQAAR
jgi:uncharacterized membrane protein YoaK (UPF0700 family)